jgi:hypothetical protein
LLTATVGGQAFDASCGSDACLNLSFHKTIERDMPEPDMGLHYPQSLIRHFHHFCRAKFQHVILAILLGFCLLARLDLAKADDQGPRAFLQAIYATYIGSDTTPGITLQNDADIARYFTPEMAQIMITAQKKAKPDEVPNWDFDPFVNAQDWIIPSVKIDVDEAAAIAAGKTTAKVSFVNQGTPMIVILDLAWTKDGWRINDIHWGDETLRHVYTE